MKVLILANNDSGLYKFRKELIRKLLEQKNEVSVCLPYGEYVDEMRGMGCRFIACELLDRHGTNPVKEIKLLKFYNDTLKQIKPDIVFTYTIKPNVYGGIICSRLRIPYVVNVTGLGMAVERGGIMQKLTLSLYKKGIKKAQRVFFQNKENMRFMLGKGLVRGEYALLPGSGVNLENYPYMEYPDTDSPVIFITIGRLMKDKGTEEIIDAARTIKKNHMNVIFRFIGDYDDNETIKSRVHSAVEDGTVEYVGSQSDVRPFIRDSHATIHASYHEGMSNVLLESAASGRPVIATNVPGCIDTFTPGVSGIACRPGDAESLVEAVEKFLHMSFEEKKTMGRMGRKKVESEFDRNIVVDAYMDELKKVISV